jgi:hypothetical protein
MNEFLNGQIFQDLKDDIQTTKLLNGNIEIRCSCSRVFVNESLFLYILIIFGGNSSVISDNSLVGLSINWLIKGRSEEHTWLCNAVKDNIKQFFNNFQNDQEVKAWTNLSLNTAVYVWKEDNNKLQIGLWDGDNKKYNVGQHLEMELIYNVVLVVQILPGSISKNFFDCMKFLLINNISKTNTNNGYDISVDEITKLAKSLIDEMELSNSLFCKICPTNYLNEYNLNIKNKKKK